ncbi:hypothetical protein ACP70R_000555 [Stipagrostis hirtigluma subsp. patula]
MGAGGSSCQKSYLQAQYEVQSDDGQPIVLGLLFRMNHEPQSGTHVLLQTDDRLTTAVQITQSGADLCVAGDAWTRFALHNKLRCGYTITVSVLENGSIQFEACNERRKRYPTRALPGPDGRVPPFTNEPVLFGRAVELTPEHAIAARALVTPGAPIPLLMVRLTKTNIQHRKMCLPIEHSICIYRVYDCTDVKLEVSNRPDLTVLTHFNVAPDGRALLIGEKWAHITREIPLLQDQLCCFKFSLLNGLLHMTVHPM